MWISKLSQALVYAKAIVAFVVAYIASLLALLEAGAIVETKTLLLALGTAIVTTYGVYQVPNRVSNQEEK